MKTANRLLKTLGILLAVASVWSCTKIDELSDENNIKSFVVTEHTNGIELGSAIFSAGPQVDTIYIPVKYGDYKFPLELDAEVTFNGDIDQIVGLNLIGGKFRDVMFENIDSERHFTVMAKSGMPKRYVIIPRLDDYRVPGEIGMTVKSVTPASTLVYPKAYIENSETMTIYVANPSFPLTIVPEFIFDPAEMEFVDFNNGKTPLTFANVSSTLLLTIIDKRDGLDTKRDIEVRLSVLTNVTGEEPTSESLTLSGSGVRPVYPDPENIDNYLGHRVEAQRDSITLIVRDMSKLDFPTTFEIGLAELANGTSVLGADLPLQALFASADDTFRFWMVDIALETVREWVVVLAELDDTIYGAEVISFEYGYDPNKVNFAKLWLKLEGCDIYPSGDIWLRMTKDVNTILGGTWGFTLQDMVPTLSEGAACDLPETLYWSAADEVHTFTVTSKDGQTKEWRIGIKNLWKPSPASSEATILNASIKAIRPIMAQAETTLVSGDDKKITIALKEDDGAYPISVYMDYVVSDFATVTSQQGNTEPLVFDTPESVQAVRVTAEDGESFEDWTVVLQQPVKTVGTKVTLFKVNSVTPSGFEIDNAVIDEGNRTIMMTLTNSSSCPLTVNYSMTLSRGASIKEEEIGLTGNFTFGRLTQAKSFTIVGNGEENVWTVKFADYAPQLKNWTLEEWEGNNPKPKGTSTTPYWATANNSFVTQTTKGTGNGGGAAARLETKSAPLVGLAAGSLFLGWFDLANSVKYGTSDPVRLTFQGIPFSATKKVVGMELDVNYTSVSNDTGSVAIEMVKKNAGASSYIYHGLRPDGKAHSENTATHIAKGRNVIGNASKTGVTNVIAAGEWSTIRVNLDYGSSDPFDYTHLNVICSSSSEGDSFEGGVGTVMLIDNVKLIYE